MTIGTGIALAGVWLFVGMVAVSKQMTGLGFLTSLATAFIVTMCLI